MKKITMEWMGNDEISIHYSGEWAKPFCILPAPAACQFFSKTDWEEAYTAWGNFVMAKKGRFWVLFLHGELKNPLVVLDKEAFLWIKERLQIKLTVEDRQWKSANPRATSNEE
ncbi:MAG: hypothetical protein M0R32_09630 [Candidatus Cloacimonetes bacterium]|jgi:hypothetical protein|nr:hypothetical protein [Candidatus Cloacimonadota bacterium]